MRNHLALIIYLILVVVLYITIHFLSETGYVPAIVLTVAAIKITVDIVMSKRKVKKEKGL